MAENIKVYDYDGHIIESIAEMVPFLDPVDREIALNPSRNRQGVFAGLDVIHYPRNVHKSGRSRRHAVRASTPAVTAKAPAKTGSLFWRRRELGDNAKSFFGSK